MEPQDWDAQLFTMLNALQASIGDLNASIGDLIARFDERLARLYDFDNILYKLDRVQSHGQQQWAGTVVAAFSSRHRESRWGQRQSLQQFRARKPHNRRSLTYRRTSSGGFSEVIHLFAGHQCIYWDSESLRFYCTTTFSVAFNRMTRRNPQTPCRSLALNSFLPNFDSEQRPLGSKTLLRGLVPCAVKPALSGSVMS